MSDTSGSTFGSSMAAKMMQAMGINPQEIIQTVEGYGKTINAFAVQLNEQRALLATIVDQQAVIIQRMNANGITKINADSGGSGTARDAASGSNTDGSASGGNVAG